MKYVMDSSNEVFSNNMFWAIENKLKNNIMLKISIKTELSKAFSNSENCQNAV